jgi:hypothetical protein
MATLLLRQMVARLVTLNQLLMRFQVSFALTKQKALGQVEFISNSQATMSLNAPAALMTSLLTTLMIGTRQFVTHA